MSTRFKYVVIMDGTMETPIIFPDWATHKEIAHNRKVVSAGFLTIIATRQTLEDTVYTSNDIEFNCSGGSVSLNVQSRPQEDSQLLRNFWKRTLN